MRRARLRWESSTRFHQTVTITTVILLVAWITVYLIGSAVAGDRGYLDTGTSFVVTILAPIVVAFATCNLVLGLRLTARLKAEESSDILE